MADSNSTKTNSDTDSSVIFVGTSKNIQIEAEVHKEDEIVIPETPPKQEQLTNKKKILRTFPPAEADKTGNVPLTNIQLIQYLP